MLLAKMIRLIYLSIAGMKGKAGKKYSNYLLRLWILVPIQSKMSQRFWLTPAARKRIWFLLGVRDYSFCLSQVLDLCIELV